MAFAAVGLVAFGTSGNSLAQTAPGPQGTPPPPPVPASLPSNEAPPTIPTTTPTPEPFSSPSAAPEESPSPQSRGRRGHRGGLDGPSPAPSPSETPEPPQFSNLNGVWEIALQPLNGGRTTYSHLYVTQDGNTLTGTWRRTAKAELPFTGTFDGRLFKIAIADGAVTEQLSGYEENYSDMVGLYTDGDPKHQGTPFTAAHRKPSHDRGVNIAP
jgi:hypothetical protein